MSAFGAPLVQEHRFWSALDAQEYSCDEIIDCDNMILAPGFIDIQINGAFGVDFSNPEIGEDDIERVAVGLVKVRPLTRCVHPLLSVQLTEWWARWRRLLGPLPVLGMADALDVRFVNTWVSRATLSVCSTA